MSEGPLTVLSIGNGPDPMTGWVERGYKVVRLDIDPATNPDVVGDMRNLGDIGPFDTIYCSHALEHLYPHEVPTALAEMHRVLRPGGTAVITVPDLEGVPATDEILPGSTNLCGLQLIYGDHSEIPDRPYMAHHSGFVASTLRAAMEAAGFEVMTDRLAFYNLMGVGIKRERKQEE